MIHESYRSYKRFYYHKQFRTALDTEYESHMKDVYRKQNTAAKCDKRLFWKLGKEKKKRTSHTYPEIHGDDGAIFKDPESQLKPSQCTTKKIYTPSKNDTFYEHFRKSIGRKYKHIKVTCTKVCGNIPSGPIFMTIYILSPVVKKIPRLRQDNKQTNHLRRWGKYLQ